jgi:hypothetical protein
MQCSCVCDRGSVNPLSASRQETQIHDVGTEFLDINM